MSVTSYLLWGLISIPILFLLRLHLKLRKNAAFFQKHNIPYFGPTLPQMAMILLQGIPDMVKLEESLYNAAVLTKAPMVGMSDLAGNKNIYLRDMDTIRSIFTKDFDHFVNRRPVGTQKSNKYFRKMLVSMDDDPWKGMRAKLSPSFTTGKIKRMFEIFKTSSERMEIYLKEQMDYPTEKSVDVDFLQIFPKYTMDVIASCAFGVDSKSFEVTPDEKSTFEKMGSQFGIKFDIKGFFRFTLMMVAPKIADLFEVDIMDRESQGYFATVIKDVMKRRRQTGERRDDFLQLMMDAQDGMLKADEESKQVLNGSSAEENKFSLVANEGKIGFDDDAVIANALMFLMAGFDPTQSLLLFTLYGLALEPEVQEKLYKEVKEQADKNKGQLTYDAVNEMKYLDLVLNESLRFYPPATRTERLCTKDHTLPDSNLLIEKGDYVVFPIYGIHHDPVHFPNPEKFDPERHTPENKADRHPYAFMPFGHGPRNCIGMRFALVEVKAAVAQLVHSFQFGPCSKTNIPLEFGSNPNVKPKKDMWLKVTARN